MKSTPLKKPTIFDVAKYILEKQGEMTAMKLQKLAYYVKVWSLVWEEKNLFEENFEAWANGAISRDLYNKHRGLFKVSADLFSNANSDILADFQKKTIDKVLEFYGKYTAQQLSDINHQESPWIDTRGNIEPYECCNKTITIASIAEYYSGIWHDSTIN